MRVLDLLAARFTYQSREEWEDRIGSGLVLLNQQPTDPKSILESGDTLAYRVPGLEEPPVDTGFSILLEDDHLLVVDKPANLPCHPAGRYFEHTLWALLKSQFNLAHLTFVNRIDRETSGIVVLAKTPEAALHCRRQFERRQVHKCYVAIVEGRFPSAELRAGGYLIRDHNSPIRKKLRFFSTASSDEIPAGGKACSTIFHKTLYRRGLSRVDVLLETGRPHQIRATLLGLGYPLVGDKLYGVDETIFLRFIKGSLTEHDKERLRLPRQALHATELRFKHPETGKPLLFRAPVPPDVKGLIDGSSLES